MVELTRTVRFCLNDGAADAEAPKDNTFSAWPPMRGLGRYYELHVRCEGEPDPATGYLMNITQIDAAVRRHALPVLRDAVSAAGPAAAPLGELMRRVAAAVRDALPIPVESVTLSLTPFYSLTLRSADMAAVLIRQQYEFSAAHRLHVDALSAQENRDVFGKCNNPSGHGHNYRLEVAARSPVDERGRACSIHEIDRAVNRAVIEKLDHKHLNVDVPQFKDLNPSVENIARVIHGMLIEPLRQIGAELEEVSVWETSKTVCTYAGDA